MLCVSEPFALTSRCAGGSARGALHVPRRVLECGYPSVTEGDCTRAAYCRGHSLETGGVSAAVVRAAHGYPGNLALSVRRLVCASLRRVPNRQTVRSNESDNICRLLLKKSDVRSRACIHDPRSAAMRRVRSRAMNERRQCKHRNERCCGQHRLDRYRREKSDNISAGSKILFCNFRFRLDGCEILNARLRMNDRRGAAPLPELWPRILATDRDPSPDPRILAVCDGLRQRFSTHAGYVDAAVGTFQIDLAIAKTIRKVATYATKNPAEPAGLLIFADTSFAANLGLARTDQRKVAQRGTVRRDAGVAGKHPSLQECIEVLRAWSVRTGHPLSEDVLLCLTRRFGQHAWRKFPFLPGELRDEGVVRLLEKLLHPSFAAGLTPAIFDARTGLMLRSLLSDINSKESMLQQLLRKAHADVKIEETDVSSEDLTEKRFVRQLNRAIRAPFEHLRNVTSKWFKWKAEAKAQGVSEDKLQQDWHRVKEATTELYERLRKFGKVRLREIDNILKSSHIPKQYRKAIRENLDVLLREWNRLLLLLPLGLHAVLARLRKWWKGGDEPPARL